MKRTLSILAVAALLLAPFVAMAQQSTSTGVSRRNSATERRQTRTQTQVKPVETASSDPSWMKVVYRSLDLNKTENAPLYYPEEVVDGQENMFRIMLGHVADGTLQAYEYLDGHERFDESGRLNVADMLDRFHIPYAEGKGHSERHPVYAVDPIDVPSAEVLGYYIIEQWEVDRADSRMRTRVTAICPVLHCVGEFGQEAVRYPMFWVRYADLRPYLGDRLIFTDDDNNAANSTYDDYFTLGLYKGDIYKTRNLRNKSMMQLYPDPDDLTRAQDSIERRLNNFESSMWVPSLEELEARAAAVEASDSTAVSDQPKRREKSSGRVASRRKAAKATKEKSSSRRASQGTVRSVRNRKR